MILMTESDEKVLSLLLFVFLFLKYVLQHH